MVLPRPVLAHLPEVKSAITKASGLLVCCDFDGTLTPLVDHYQDAWLDASALATLRVLVARPHTKMVILSGRALADLKTRTPVAGLIHVGNHGLEIMGPGFQLFRTSPYHAWQRFNEVEEELKRGFQDLPGVVVENKKFSLSVHYRLAPPNRREEILGAVQQSAAALQPAFQICPGRDVWEIRPNVSWNKGKALAWIQNHLELHQGAVLCLGDDQTDEDVFAAFPQSIPIQVGVPKNTHARYSLPGPESVLSFLNWVACL